MNHSQKSGFAPSIIRSLAIWEVVLGVMLLMGTTVAVYAQGEAASGTVTGSGTGPYIFSLEFSDASTATSAIGSVWYAWVPGSFFLPSAPTMASAPTGWTASVVGNSIQFAATSVTYDINPGHSLSGFIFDANFSPAQLAATANSGESVAYSGAIGSDSGNTFTVQAAVVPEPSPLALLLWGVGGLYLIRGWQVAGRQTNRRVNRSKQG
jgi:hypothetical protein